MLNRSQFFLVFRCFRRNTYDLLLFLPYLLHFLHLHESCIWLWEVILLFDNVVLPVDVVVMHSWVKVVGRNLSAIVVVILAVILGIIVIAIFIIIISIIEITAHWIVSVSLLISVCLFFHLFLHLASYFPVDLRDLLF